MRSGSAAYKGNKPNKPGKAGKTREVFLIPAAFRNGEQRPNKMQKHNEKGKIAEDSVGIQSKTMGRPQEHNRGAKEVASEAGREDPNHPGLQLPGKAFGPDGERIADKRRNNENNRENDGHNCPQD